MIEIVENLNNHYEAILHSTSIPLFYENIHDYIDVIIKTPKLSNLILTENNKLKNRFEEINTDPVLSEDNKEKLLIREQHLSFYTEYMRLYTRVYIPIDDSIRGELTGEDSKRIYHLMGNKNVKTPENMKLIHEQGIISSQKSYEEYLEKFHLRLLGLIQEAHGGEQEPSAPKYKFDDNESILYLGDIEVKIARQKIRTLEHKILNYIFEDPQKLSSDFLYCDFAETERDYDYDSNPLSWKKYYNACEKINNKIRKTSNATTADFLIATTGNAGTVRINKNFLKFSKIP